MVLTSLETRLHLPLTLMPGTSQTTTPLVQSPLLYSLTTTSEPSHPVSTVIVILLTSSKWMSTFPSSMTPLRTKIWSIRDSNWALGLKIGTLGTHICTEGATPPVTLVLGVMKQPLDLDTSHAFTLPEGFVKMAPIVSFFMVLLLIHWMPLLALPVSLRGWNSVRSLLGSRPPSFKE